MPAVPPFPLVIAAPSGAGKTSLARALVERRPDVVFSLSATTRPPRPGERHDEDYHFVDDAGFDRLIAGGELLEWASCTAAATARCGAASRPRWTRAHGRARHRCAGRAQVRGVLPDAVLVFMLPPSVAEMMRRLRSAAVRATRGAGDADADGAGRAGCGGGVRLRVVNDDFEQALRASRRSSRRNGQGHRAWRTWRQLLERMRADMDGLFERSRLMRVFTPGELANNSGSKYLGVLVAARYARELNALPSDAVPTEVEEKLTTRALETLCSGSVEFSLVKRRRKGDLSLDAATPARRVGRAGPRPASCGAPAVARPARPARRHRRHRRLQVHPARA
jgi:DNA-directed RNA polymerase omega subunit